MQTKKTMQNLQQWVEQHGYAASVISTLLLVGLVLGIGQLNTGVRQVQQTRQQRMEERRLTRQAKGAVWCMASFTTQDEHRFVFGYFAGQPMDEVIRWYESSTWLQMQEQQTVDCYRNWRLAAQATADIAATSPDSLSGDWIAPPKNASEAEQKLAVTTAWLDTPPVSFRASDTAAVAEAPDRWCISRLRNTDHTLYYLPHKPGGRDAAEAVLDQLPDRAHLTQYRIDETACFASESDAEKWLQEQNFVPPSGVSRAAYLETVTAWLDETEMAYP